ncbi:hypothetical protein BDV26DRAFT_103674 [Aspergillus bertholletiae]|uniref:Uncharacterized protein n=1 Tax=Aspergillus bertholletiae TaxID=1226010 RepID=A0A5N7ATS8_9EURO|nr:hypothetical protein BDV26DRAFT_103674 [Aspergillus bertholletiae]
MVKVIVIVGSSRTFYWILYPRHGGVLERPYNIRPRWRTIPLFILSVMVLLRKIRLRDSNLGGWGSKKTEESNFECHCMLLLSSSVHRSWS